MTQIILKKKYHYLEQLAGIKVEKIQNLPNDKIISSIQSTLSDTSIELLKQRLPNFYQIYLEIFPTSSELEDIKQTLLQNKNVKKVEVFYKNHNQIYLLLLLLNSVSFILFFIITIFAIIIIAKQIKLWFHEYSVKISILRLHGASILYSASSWSFGACTIWRYCSNKHTYNGGNSASSYDVI